MERKLTREEIQKSLHAYQLHSEQYELPHFPYEYDLMFFNAVASGEISQLQNMRSYYHQKEEEAQHRTTSIFYDPYKQQEYDMVGLISRLVQTAINSGVEPGLAYDTGDVYLIRLSSFTTIEEISSIYELVIEDFVSIIHYAKINNRLSYHVNRAQIFINNNLTEHLTAAEIAVALGISPNYLSGIFHKETGMTLVQYIQKQRINAAEKMLIYTDAPIENIAFHYCFSSQSNFGQVFKKVTGMSPAKFRKYNSVCLPERIPFRTPLKGMTPAK